MEKKLKKIQKLKQNEKKEPKPVNGYLILFDIVDSTKRKTDYVRIDNHWLEHLQNFYSGFTSFSNDLITAIGEKNIKTFLKGLSIIKFIGDMGFLFLPFQPYPDIRENKKAIPSISKLILEKVYEFTKINDPPIAPNLKLKTILSYIYDVYIVNLCVNDEKRQGDKGANIQKDIVGTGIDFSFRLEKYASSSCLVLNKYFYKSITSYLDLNKDGKLEEKNFDEDFQKSILKDSTHIYKSKKIVKGWSESQEFYFLTNKQMIESAFENSQSSQYNTSLSVDLFAKYIQYAAK